MWEVRLQPGQVCAVVQARGVDGADKVLAGMMETGDVREAEVTF